MNATENRLKFEMEDALRTIEKCGKEQAFNQSEATACQKSRLFELEAHYKRMASYWQQHKQEVHEWYYRAKRELKTLTTQKNAE